MSKTSNRSIRSMLMKVWQWRRGVALSAMIIWTVYAAVNTPFRNFEIAFDWGGDDIILGFDPIASATGFVVFLPFYILLFRRGLDYYTAVFLLAATVASLALVFVFPTRITWPLSWNQISWLTSAAIANFIFVAALVYRHAIGLAWLPIRFIIYTPLVPLLFVDERGALVVFSAVLAALYASIGRDLSILIARREELRTLDSAAFFFIASIANIGWIIVIYGKIYVLTGLAEDLSTGMYFSVVTWTTLGYGDITPNLAVHRFFAASEAISGLMTVPLLTAGVVSMMQIVSRYPSRSDDLDLFRKQQLIQDIADDIMATHDLSDERSAKRAIKMFEKRAKKLR